jgi:hypothetical protein
MDLATCEVGRAENASAPVYPSDLPHGGDDRIMCRWCVRYDPEAFQCRLAKPPLARIADIRHRCYYFTPADPAKRIGAQRWPELKDAPGGPMRVPHPQRKEK